MRLLAASDSVIPYPSDTLDMLGEECRPMGKRALWRSCLPLGVCLALEDRQRRALRVGDYCEAPGVEFGR